MSYLILTRNWLYILGSVLLFVLFSSGMAQAAQSAAERGVGGIVGSGIVQYRASWAVVIGINRYTKAPRLNYAVNDAKRIVAAVQQLGFASDKILLLLDEEERLAREKARSEQAQREIKHKRQVEEAAKVELANLEMERARLQAAAERIAKEKARTEEARLEAERKEKGGEASKAFQAQVIPSYHRLHLSLVPL